METVRVCVVGVGRAGMVHARNLRWYVPHAALVAVVDEDRARAREAADELELGAACFSGLEEALRLADFEAVVITSPTYTHRPLATAAAQAAKHILCEKPMAITVEDCDRMREAARQAGVVLQLGFMRRFDPPFVAAKEQIESGAVGQPLIVRSLTRGPGLPPEWAHDVRMSNGMLAEVNSHDFDTVRWLAGANYTEIFALAAARKVPDLKERFPEFYDTAVVLLHLDNGAFGTIDGVCPVEYGYDARAEVVGTKGVLVIGELRNVATTRVTREGGLVERNFLSWRERFAQAYRDEASHFVDCIRSGRQPVVTGYDGRCAVEAVRAANESIRSGLPVRIPFEQ